MIKKKDEEFFIGQTEKNMKETGIMGNNMEREPLFLKMELREKVNGIMERE